LELASPFFFSFFPNSKGAWERFPRKKGQGKFFFFFFFLSSPPSSGLENDSLKKKLAAAGGTKAAVVFCCVSHVGWRLFFFPFFFFFFSFFSLFFFFWPTFQGGRVFTALWQRGLRFAGTYGVEVSFSPFSFFVFPSNGRRTAGESHKARYGGRICVRTNCSSFFPSFLSPFPFFYVFLSTLAGRKWCVSMTSNQLWVFFFFLLFLSVLKMSDGLLNGGA